EEHEARLTARVRTVQAPGGCGALRLGAELIRAVSPDSVVYVSTPTWANHSPLLSGSGLKLAPYPYFDPATGGVQFAAMAAALGRLPARAVVLLHASCHNPTGADLSPAQWRELLELVRRRQLPSATWCASRAASGRCRPTMARRSCTGYSPSRRCARAGRRNSPPCASVSRDCATRW